MSAQSPFDVFDQKWEQFQHRNPWAYRLDDTPPKTWAWHGVITIIAGGAVGALTPLSARDGRHVVAAFYVVRELYNATLARPRSSDLVDTVMDAAVPIAVARIRF